MALIYGGDGDDYIVGSPNIDNIYGGAATPRSFIPQFCRGRRWVDWGVPQRFHKAARCKSA